VVLRTVYQLESFKSQKIQDGAKHNGLRQPFRSIIDENKHDIVLGLIGSSIILFMLTIYVAIPAFAYFPADPFYYMHSLPAFYWIGISITILPLIIPSYNKSKIIFVIMLGLYLHALPVILFNNPRHADVYSHEASTISLLNNRGFATEIEYSYAREYPGAFLFEAIQSLLTGMPHFILIKFTSIFLLILPGVLIYLPLKDTYPTLASIAPLAFFATFVNDQDHFSPQLFALSLYLMLLLGIQRVSSYNKGAEKAWIIITMLAIVVVNISNPTQSYFLLGNLLAGFILMRLLRKPFRWNNKIIEDRIWTLLILTTVIFISWSAYVAVGKAIYEPEDLARDFVTSFNSLGLNQIPIHPNPPDESVKIATYIGYFVRIGTLIMGITTFVILFLRRKFLTNRSAISYLIVTAALLVTSISFVPFASLITTTHTFLLRAIMYAGISWSISLPFFMSLPFPGGVARRQKYLPLAFGIVSIIFMPIAKYGADYLSFNPSSELYMADFMDQHSGKAYLALPITDNTWPIFFYYHTLNHNSSLPVLRPYPEEYSEALAEGKEPLDYIRPQLRDWTYTYPNQLVVSFGYQGSFYVLHEGDKEYLQGLEAYMKLHHNLVSYAGQARTYITTP
jgi:hypothetical protein